MTRHRRRKYKHNPIDWKRYRPSTRGLLVAGGVVAATAITAAMFSRRSKGSGHTIRPAIMKIPIPKPKPDSELPPRAPVPEGYGTRSYGASTVIKVSLFGDEYDVVLRSMKPGESTRITVEARISTWLKYNQYYGNAQHEFCLGIVMYATVTMGQYNGTITDQSHERVDALCGDDPRTDPWPNNSYGNLEPKISIDTDGHDLVVRIDAPALLYGDATPDPQGEPTAWYDDHVQQHAYDMNVTLAVIEKAA